MSCILIVDDEPDSSAFVASFLRQNGYTTRCLANGREALAHLLNRLPAAVVLDVRMPEMDGISLLEVMRSYLRWHALPVIILTAHATPQQLERARDLGAVAVFQKSQFRLVELLEVLRRAVPPAAAPGSGSA